MSDIKSDDIKVLFVPMYKELSIKFLLAEGMKDVRVADYLPDLRDLHRCPRNWLINVISTIVGDSFREFVNKKIKNRNDHVAENRKLLIELDPAVARAF